MKYIKFIVLTVLITILLNIPIFAAEKDYSVNIEKTYSSAKFRISLPDNREYSAIINSPDKKEVYEAVATDDGNLECIINDTLKQGEWTVKITRQDEELYDTEGNPIISEETAIEGVKITFEGSTEKLVDVTKGITVAEDIVGLSMYFKDDSFIAEWSDTTCGDVNIEITNENTNETLSKETVNGRYFELPLENTVKSIVVKICPATSAREEGAEKSYVYQFDNHPNATVTYADYDITNQDTYNVEVEIRGAYSVLMLNNGERVNSTEILKEGTYTFDLPTEIGDNNYLVYIIDEKGNMRSTAGYVEKDVVAPILQLVKEYSQIVTEDENIVFEGRVEDYDTFTINDAPIEIEGDHTFKYAYSLKEGTNKINIVAMDKAGNISSYTSVVERIIPVEKPIPWLKIIIGCVAAVMIGWYIVDVVKKYRYGDEKKSNRNNNKAIKEKHDSEYSQAKRRNTAIKEILNLVIPLVVIYILLTYIIGIVVIQSASMEPTLMTGNTVFVNRLSYKTGNEVQRGNIIVFNSKEYGKIFGKRVIGLPGDTIEFKSGYVVLNGQYCDESAYLAEDIETNSPKTFVVPEGCYFVLGDNREYSNDARYWQEPYISKEDIIGSYMGQIDFSIQFDIIERFLK